MAALIVIIIKFKANRKQDDVREQTTDAIEANCDFKRILVTVDADESFCKISAQSSFRRRCLVRRSW